MRWCHQQADTCCACLQYVFAITEGQGGFIGGHMWRSGDWGRTWHDITTKMAGRLLQTGRWGASSGTGPVYSQQSLQAVLCDICSAPHRHGRTGPRPAVSEARQLLPPSMHTTQSSCNAPRGAGTPLGSPLLIAGGLIATVVRTIVSLPGLEGQSLTAYSITSHASRQCFGLCRRWRGTYF